MYPPTLKSYWLSEAAGILLFQHFQPNVLAARSRQKKKKVPR